MMIQATESYTEFCYLYPPRPTMKILPASIGKYPSDEYTAQVKYNGSCAMLFVSPEGEWQFWDRHRTTLPCQRKISFEQLSDPRGWNCFAGEWMNKNKKGEDGTPFNHRYIIFDILVHAGVYLTGTTFTERQQILTAMLPASSCMIDAHGKLECYEYVDCTTIEGVYLAKSINSNFKEHYKEIVKTDAYEGLVLKRRNGRLQHGYNAGNNDLWQLKVRKQTRNYAF